MNRRFNYSPIAPSFLFLPLFSFSHSLSPPFPYISHLFFPLFLLFFFFPPVTVQQDPSQQLQLCITALE